MTQSQLELTPPGIGAEDLAYIINSAFQQPTLAAMVEEQVAEVINATGSKKKRSRPQWKHKADAASARHQTIIDLCQTWFKSSEIVEITGENIHTTLKDLRDLAARGHLERRTAREGRSSFNAYRAIS